jgi:hypothetical protein
MDVDNYRFQVLEPLAEALGVPKLNFQVMRRTMAMQAQKMGSVKDIHAHLRHLRPDTTAKEVHAGAKDWWAQQDSNLRLPPCEGEK